MHTSQEGRSPSEKSRPPDSPLHAAADPALTSPVGQVEQRDTCRSGTNGNRQVSCLDRPYGAPRWPLERFGLAPSMGSMRVMWMGSQ